MHVPYFFADKYLCYYCTKATSAENEILHHLDHYHPMEKLSVRARILCEKSGKYHWRLQTFALAGASGGERQRYGANSRLRGVWGHAPGENIFLIMQNAANWAIFIIFVRP